MTFLDASFIDPPARASLPVGQPVSFSQTVFEAGMQMVVSGNHPDIFVHDGEKDLVVVKPGQNSYCIASRNLPPETRMRARETLRRLAYSFHDWASRETVARYHRDLKRNLLSQAIGLPRSPDGLSGPVRIRRFLRANPASTIGQIAEATGVAQSNVSRTITKWEAEGTINIERDGRFALCSLVETDPEEVARQAFGR